MKKTKTRKIKWIPVSLILIGLLLVSSAAFAAQSTLHPTFPLLDSEGEKVILTDQAVSAYETCGQCHDTAFITSTSFHSTMDMEVYGPEGEDTELNCFLCHISEPNNEARMETLLQGEFEWASTATLLGTGLIEEGKAGFIWNAEAFNDDGEVQENILNIQDPTSENCGQCHGTVHTGTEPLNISGCEDTGEETSTTGQIFSAQRINDSAMNLSNKEDLTRSFDIHIERGLDCVDCHYSLNNPVYANGQGADSLDHLVYDPRVLEIGEYLEMPSHEFARGASTENILGDDVADDLRGCDSCHDSSATHDWLPYADKHMDSINCQACHIPQIYSAAIQSIDNTVVQNDGHTNLTCRGVEGDSGKITDLVTGYSPAILLRENSNGEMKFSPYNLITTWSWQDGDNPISEEDLIAIFNLETYELVELFDENADGKISNSEMILDTDEKEQFIANRLKNIGYVNPEIIGKTEAYAINHNASNGDWAIQECDVCHSEDSKLTMAFEISDKGPRGQLPEFISDNSVITDGEFSIEEDGSIFFKPAPEEQGNYIFGHNKVRWVDWFGVILFLGVLVGVVTHGALRVIASKKAPKTDHKTKRIYMYTFYERLWHWLQTIVILMITFTGLIIHKPEMFGIFSFKFVVLVHNILAGILVANAALALFYNLVSGDIQRFLPQPQGFFNQMIQQVKYYTYGIFRGEAHPEEKSREKRLNPLQKVTYFGILNVLLPLQILTGIFMWGVQRWPSIAESLGGLAFLAPFHTLVAWSFSSFILAHVYLTTTAGHTAMAGIKSMVRGWEEVEITTKEEQE